MTLTAHLIRPLRQTLATLGIAALLAACGSKAPAVDKGPDTASTGKAAPASHDELPPLPALDEPQLDAMLQKIAPEYRRWLSDPDGYLPAAQPGPWPCAVAQADRERLAGIPNPRDPKVLAAFAKQERASGMKRGTLKPPGVENPQVHLLKGQCVRGRLQGEVVLLAEYVSVVHGLDDETRIPQQVMSRLTVKDNKPVGQVFKALIQGEHQHTKPPPVQVKTASATFSLGDSATAPARGVSIGYMRTESPKPGSGKYISVTQQVNVQVPLRADRWKQVSYNGPTKIAETYFKGDQRHGKSIGYAYEVKSPFSRDPVRIPASETCFNHGEQIKSAACDAD